MNQRIRIAPNLFLPLDTITQSLAILARKRAGKSYLARGFAEQLLAADQQVVIIDPKGDWWGIRSSSDGKSPGFPVVVLGGEHGDLPLEKSAADTVARLIVEERVSVLLDLSEFRKSEVALFLGGDVRQRADGLLEIMYRLKAKEEFRTPVMLIVDEADAIAPQKPYPGEERMLGAMSDIVRRGGQRGLGSMLITQRSSVINKDVLTQTQVMIAMRTIAALDMAAIMGWVDVHGVPEQAKVLKTSLPSLPTGDAWILSPGWPTETGIFERIHGNAITTFDSGATPKPGEKRIKPKNLADVDLAALQRRMAETIERKKHDDPVELRRQIAELKKQILKPAAAAVRVDHFAGAEALAKAREAGATTVRAELRRRMAGYERAMGAAIAGMRKSLEEAIARLGSVPAFPNLEPTETAATPARLPQERPAAVPRASVPPPAPRPQRLESPASSDAALTTAERKILTALAQYPKGLSKERLAILTGHQLNGTFYNRIGALRTRGAISPSGPGPIAILDAGSELLGTFDPLPTGEDLRRYWLHKVSTGERKILQVLFDAYPDSVPKERLAEASGHQLNGTYYNRIGALRTKGLVTPANTTPQASPDLFEPEYSYA